jgi:hypothetical protein
MKALYDIATGEVKVLNPSRTTRRAFHIEAGQRVFDDAIYHLKETDRATFEAGGPFAIVDDALAQRPLNAEEQARADDKEEREQIQAVYLDLKNGEGTQTQRLVRVEQVLSRILKDHYKPS